MLKTTGILILLAALPLRADALGDLNAALGRLRGGETTQVSFEYQFWREIKEDGKPMVTQGVATARVEDGPQGLRMAWDRATLNQAEAELALEHRDPAKTAPITQILRNLTPLDVAEHMHGAEVLTRTLVGAKLLETRSEPYLGRPATLLKLQLEPVMHPNIRKSIKEVKAFASIWVGADGTPMAYKAEVNYRGSRFLISYHGTQKEEYHYQHKGGRLLVNWSQYEERTSGFGQSVATKKVYKLTPAPF